MSHINFTYLIYSCWGKLLMTISIIDTAHTQGQYYNDFLGPYK